MNDSTRVAYALVESAGLVADGAPIVIWGVINTTAETFNIMETDGEGDVSATEIMELTSTAEEPVFSFPFGIQCPRGAATQNTSDVVTILYTKI